MYECKKVQQTFYKIINIYLFIGVWNMTVLSHKLRPIEEKDCLSRRMVKVAF